MHPYQKYWIVVGIGLALIIGVAIILPWFMKWQESQQVYGKVWLEVEPRDVIFDSGVSSVTVSIKYRWSPDITPPEAIIEAQNVPSSLSYTFDHGATGYVSAVMPYENLRLTVMSRPSTTVSTYINLVLKEKATGAVLYTVTLYVTIMPETAGTQGKVILTTFPHVKLESNGLIKVKRESLGVPYQIVVKKGSEVKVYVKLAVSGGDYWRGTVKVEVRKDIVAMPDQTYTWLEREVVVTSKTGEWIYIGSFTATETTSDSPWPGTFRQYFFKIYVDDKCIYDPHEPSTREHVEVKEQ